MPRNGAQLVGTRRPGVELVVSPHKSVAELGVIGRAEDMHAIVDAERDATLAYLDRECKKIGGRRGEAATPTKTGGLDVGDVSACDDPGRRSRRSMTMCWSPTWSGCETTAAAGRGSTPRSCATSCTPPPPSAVWPRPAWRSSSATPSSPTTGRSGRLGGWLIAGIPDEALAVHSQRSAQIDDIAGPDASYRERNAAARQNAGSQGA